MLNDLIDKGIINKEHLLLSYYKEIGLSENELILILLIMHISAIKNSSVSAKSISELSNFDEDYIDQAIDELDERELIKIKVSPKGRVKLDIEPIFQIISVKLSNQILSIENNVVYDSVNFVLETSLNNEQKIILNKLIKDKISDNSLITLVNSIPSKITFEKLLDVINKRINMKPKGYTKFNWLKSNN
ncbi:DnaD family protein [Spiroplasma endosymbiont of Amphibalanus improvisus]|uniref:DnaD family protein n=1 Tax=Spiroplasma endosymbiont of Amphibalanus improvisus TaxID=3066327 RepID=UPI00313A98D0